MPKFGKRHNLDDYKACLNHFLGKYRKDYWIILRKYLCAEISRWEMKVAMKMILPKSAVPIHNKMLIAILHNSSMGAPPPKRRRSTINKEDPKLRGRASKKLPMIPPALGPSDNKDVTFHQDGSMVHRDPVIPNYEPLRHLPMENLHTAKKYFQRFSEYANLDEKLAEGPFEPESTVRYSYCVKDQLPSFHQMRQRLMREANKYGMHQVSDEAVLFIQRALHHHLKSIIDHCFEEVKHRRMAGRQVRKIAFLTSPPAALNHTFTDAMRAVPSFDNYYERLYSRKGSARSEAQSSRGRKEVSEENVDASKKNGTAKPEVSDEASKDASVVVEGSSKGALDGTADTSKDVSERAVEPTKGDSNGSAKPPKDGKEGSNEKRAMEIEEDTSNKEASKQAEKSEAPGEDKQNKVEQKEEKDEAEKAEVGKDESGKEEAGKEEAGKDNIGKEDAGKEEAQKDNAEKVEAKKVEAEKVEAEKEDKTAKDDAQKEKEKPDATATRAGAKRKRENETEDSVQNQSSKRTRDEGHDKNEAVKGDDQKEASFSISQEKNVSSVKEVDNQKKGSIGSKQEVNSVAEVEVVESVKVESNQEMKEERETETGWMIKLRQSVSGKKPRFERKSGLALTEKDDRRYKRHKAIMSKTAELMPKPVSLHMQMATVALDPDFRPEFEGLLPDKAAVKVEDLGAVLQKTERANLIGPIRCMVLEKLRAMYLRA